MHIETALKAYLKAQSGITDICGQRIYFASAPQSVIAPYLVLSKISSPRSMTHDGPDGMTDARFQLSAFAKKYGDAKELIVAVQDALSGYKGTMGGEGGIVVACCTYDDETDLDPGEQGLFGVAADYIIQHYE